MGTGKMVSSLSQVDARGPDAVSMLSGCWLLSAGGYMSVRGCTLLGGRMSVSGRWWVGRARAGECVGVAGQHTREVIASRYLHCTVFAVREPV